MDAEIQKSDGSQHVKSSKSQRPCPVTVKIVKREGKTVLCAWMDGDLYRQALVPSRKVKGNEVDAAALEKCLPYGLPWETLLSTLPNADAIANDLRRRGIWTADDFKRGRAEVNAAILSTFVNPFVTKLVKEF